MYNSVTTLAFELACFLLENHDHDGSVHVNAKVSPSRPIQSLDFSKRGYA